jgi:S1-C subfamily serine protease
LLLFLQKKKIASFLRAPDAAKPPARPIDRPSVNRVLLLAVVAVFAVLVGLVGQLGRPHTGAFAQAADLVGVPGQFQELLSGTGFFIAYDGRLLTAAHVVNGCERVDIASPTIPPTRVETLMVHPNEDIALLMARHVVPKAILRYGGPSQQARRLFVLGYPGDGDLLKASETWADLANPAFNNPGLDARGALLMQTEIVTHGWSGGPVIDPVSGNVVAITRALPSKAALARVGGAGLDHIVEAQGAWIIRSFLEESLTGYIPAFPPATQSAAMAMGRNATVHVFCWRHKAPAPQHS